MSRRIQTLARNHPFSALAGLLLIGFAVGLAGCDADSPSEPQQQPGPPPGTGPGGTAFNITVTVSPPEVPAGSTDPVQVTVRVVRADTGQPPPNGTTVVLAASGGSFEVPGGEASDIVGLFNGQATTTFFPPPAVGTGTVIIQARLDNSIGQAALRIAEPATFFIAAVTPSVGSPNGGEEVTIQGGGFEDPVRVTFGGVPAQVLSVSDTRIRVLTPPSPSAVPVGGTLPVAVAVTVNLNEEDEATDVLPSAFIFARGGTVNQPLVFSVTPASGPNEGGTRITITGEGFQAPVQVFFGDGSSAADFTGIEATVQSVAGNQIVVLSPSATGFGQDNRNTTVNILVKNLNSGFATVATSAFRYGVGIIISAINPNEVPEVPGTDDLVTIFGQGFEAPLVVEVGDVQPQVISVTGTEIVFRPEPFRGGVPCGSRVSGGLVTVRLINSDESASGPALFFTGPAQFIITAVKPTSGDEDGGFTITIEGQNFVDPVRVSFEGPEGSATVAGDASADGTTVTVTAPDFTGKLEEEQCDDNGDGQVGSRFLPTTVDIVVSNPVTGCSDTFPDAFTFRPDDTSCRGDIGEPPPPPAPQCSDELDNDGDGLTDFNDGVSPPGDPQCMSDGDNSEAS